MCGIYGFVRTSGDKDALRDLRRIGAVASSRGADACGVAASVTGEIIIRKASGPFVTHPEILADLDAALVVIGHARLATSSDYSLGSAQPMHRGDVAIAHNGTVPDHRKVAGLHGVRLETGCDSELLAAIASATPGTPVERIEQAIKVLPSNTPHAILAIVAGVLVVACAGLPLHWETLAAGVYFSSRTFSDSCRPVRPGIHGYALFS